MDRRIKELDGLRGLAVIMVIALHTFKRAANFTQHPILLLVTNLTSAGWVGVDIFFVLSGFLITSILLRTKDGPHYFKNFYIRRTLRILPLYYLGLTAILLLIPTLDPGYISQIPRDLPFLLLYQQNWISVFGGRDISQYLSVTWSLAIEEQFYLVWPAIVYFTRKESLWKFGIGAVLVSFASRAVITLLWGNLSQATNFFFYNTFTRFEELLVGGLLAMAFTQPALKEHIRAVAMPIFLGSLFVFLGLCLSSYPNIPHPTYNNIPLTIGGYTSAALFSAALIASLITSAESSILRRFFQNKLLIQWGKYSYSAYLFHLPIALILLDVFSHNFLIGWKAYFAYIALTFSITFVFAFTTWHLFEKHILNLKEHFEYS